MFRTLTSDTYLFMNATQENVDVARNWLVNMGAAADAHDINIQYCLTLTKCGLQVKIENGVKLLNFSK